MNELIYDNRKYTDADESLFSAVAYIADSLVAESLGVDTLTAEVRDYQLQTRLLAADGMLLAADGMLLATEENETGLKEYVYGSPVEYRHNDALIGKFYLEQINRVGSYGYKISAISAVGLLLKDNYYGGVYSGITVSDLIRDIIGGVFTYTIDADFGTEPVYGLLKKATRRDSLRDVLFAQGGQIRKDANGEIIIGPQIGLTPYNITPDEFYQGGSVAGLTPATGIKLTEHTYLALYSDERITLFDGEAAAEEITTPKGAVVMGVLVEFSEPMHDLQAENVSILESGANYAVLSQSPSATLTGQKYTHTERVLTRSQNISSAPNVVPSNACTLVNMLNSENVADRLMAYYGSAKEIEADLVVTTQKPGDAVEFTDPYGDKTSGYISELDITMSSILKARANLVSGYIPTSSGNYYAHVAVITEDTVWTTPAECKGKIRMVLIGGGEGGGMGQNGKNSGKTESDYGTPGEGGEPGKQGAGGKIFIITTQAKPGQQFVIKIGAGGQKETATTPATFGGATTMGDYSSDDGLSSDTGYVNLLDGTTYGQIGMAGIAGSPGSSRGNPSPSIIYNGVTYTGGAQGPLSVAGNEGGFGGGAAAGSNGGDGGKGDSDIGGGGGVGGNAVSPNAPTTPGQGGTAGNGGGGGGARGAPQDDMIWSNAPIGYGGTGSEGSDGAPGVVLIYY